MNLVAAIQNYTTGLTKLIIPGGMPNNSVIIKLDLLTVLIHKVSQIISGVMK